MVTGMGVWWGPPLLLPRARTRPGCPGFPVPWGPLPAEPLCPAPCPLAPHAHAAPAPLPSGPPLRAAPLRRHHPCCRSISSLIYFCCSAAQLFSLLLSRLRVSSAQGCKCSEQPRPCPSSSAGSELLQAALLPWAEQQCLPLAVASPAASLPCGAAGKAAAPAPVVHIRE